MNLGTVASTGSLGNFNWLCLLQPDSEGNASAEHHWQRRQLANAGSSLGSGRPCLAAESHTIKLCEDLSGLYGQFNYLPCALHLRAFDLLGGLFTE